MSESMIIYVKTLKNLKLPQRDAISQLLQWLKFKRLNPSTVHEGVEGQQSTLGKILAVS